MTALWCVVLALGANAYEGTFQSAADAYAKADYATAIERYEQLIDENVHQPAVFYNLGNAYYRNGRLAAAIANYERALALNPSLDGARENLEQAVRRTERQLGRPLPSQWEQSLLFWHYGLGRKQTCILAGLFWIAFWSVLGFRQWRPARYTRLAAVFLFVFAASFGASAWVKLHPVPLAVADRDKTPVHYGTDDTATVRFELNAGDRVLVDKRLNGWSRVTTVDGQRGWTHDDTLVFVGPPYEHPPKGTPVPEAQL